jgi:thiol-disulfide isomerase/thioredoxin
LLLNDVTENLADVEHIEVDAEGHLDLVRELGIMRTPTTLILDKSGDIVGRAVGVPRREEVIAALAQVR